MNTDFIKGVVVPMITPIDQDELIDEKAIRSQVDYVCLLYTSVRWGFSGEWQSGWKGRGPGKAAPCCCLILWHKRQREQKR